MKRKPVVFTDGQQIGRSVVTKFNIEKFKTLLTCVCGTEYIMKNSELNKRSNPSCGKCPRIWLKGEVFGKWLVGDYLGNKIWQVFCECGIESSRKSQDLRSGDTTHCGCSPKKKKCKDITGKVSGKLTAQYNTGKKSSNGDAIWNFQCSCGNSVETTIGRFNYGRTKSCGCLKSEVVQNREDYHGMEGTHTYNSWRKMRERCNNPNDSLYPKYGALGIKVCPEWDKNFVNFLKDMGTCPEGFTIDRIELSKGYYKGNCRWASKYVQNRNKGSYTGTSKYKGVQYESSSGKWIATFSLGKIKSKKIGRYLSEEDAAKAYNLVSTLLFGKDSTYLELNDVDESYENINQSSKFFLHWLPLMKTELEECYE